MQKVTDPEILRQLNEGRMQKVTDPEILRQLNGEATKEPEETMMDKFKRYLVKDPAAGLEQMTEGMRPGGDDIAQHMPEVYRQSMGTGNKKPLTRNMEMPKTPDSLDALMQAVPDIATSIALPEAKLGKIGALLEKMPGWSKYLTKGVETAIPQAALSAAEAPEGERIKRALVSGVTALPFGVASKMAESPSRLTRTIARGSGAGLGGLAGYEMADQIPYLPNELGAMLGAAVGGKFPKTSPKTTERHVLEGVENLNYQPGHEAGQRLGLNLSAGESSGNPYQAGKEATLGSTMEGSQKLYEAGVKRDKRIEENFDDLFKKVYNKEKERPIKQKFYKESEHVKVPEGKLKDLRENDVYKAAEKSIESTPEFSQLAKSFDKNSVGYQDLIKKAIDKKIREQKTAGTYTKGGVLTKTKKDLLRVLDEAAPETYGKAREIASREITLRNFKKIFDEKKGVNAQDFSRYVESPGKFNRLMDSLKTVPEAQSTIRDMKLAYKNLIPTPTARSVAALTRTFMNRDRSGFVQALKNELSKKMNIGGNDLHAVSIITGNEWPKLLSELDEPTKRQLFSAAMIKTLGKGASGFTNSQREPEEGSR